VDGESVGKGGRGGGEEREGEGDREGEEKGKGEKGKGRRGEGGERGKEEGSRGTEGGERGKEEGSRGTEGGGRGVICHCTLHIPHCAVFGVYDYQFSPSTGSIATCTTLNSSSVCRKKKLTFCFYLRGSNNNNRQSRCRSVE